MFKITALLCVLAVNGQNLCMVGDLPTQSYFSTVEQCRQTASEIGQAVNEEFIQRSISLSMQCVKIGENVWWYMVKRLHNGKTML